MSDKIKIFEGGCNPNELKEALRTLKVNLPEMQEYLKIHAQMIKWKYDALLEEGFSKEQAIELCRKLFD
jgi:hypothetical protein